MIVRLHDSALIIPIYQVIICNKIFADKLGLQTDLYRLVLSELRLLK